MPFYEKSNRFFFRDGGVMAMRWLSTDAKIDKREHIHSNRHNCILNTIVIVASTNLLSQYLWTERITIGLNQQTHRLWTSTVESQNIQIIIIIIIMNKNNNTKSTVYKKKSTKMMIQPAKSLQNSENLNKNKKKMKKQWNK